MRADEKKAGIGEMIKVLMSGASNIGKAGVATIAFRLGQAMDEKIVQVSYLAQRGITDMKYKKMIEEKGGKIYTMDAVCRNKFHKMIKTIQWLNSVCREDSFDAFHINTDTAYLAAIYLWLAKRAGIKKNVVHCHSTMVDENNRAIRGIKIVLHKLCRRYVKKNANIKLACSNSAAKWLFGKESVTIIPNGFDVDRFAFSEQKRTECRKHLNLGDKFVLCSVGRLAYPKNPLFTIDIYQEILKREKNSVLLFVGEGELHSEIENYARENQLDSNQVILLGNRSDIPELLSASDIFLLPSRFEGLGIVYMEAQASGMPVFASDMVPEEAFVTNLIHKVRLTDSPARWAEKIIAHRNDARKDVQETIKREKFDIRAASRMLQEKYLEL